MSKIDIRETPEVITDIVIADPRNNERFNVLTLRKYVCSQGIKISSEGNSYLLTLQYEHDVRNMIKALELALSLGWCEK